MIDGLKTREATKESFWGDYKGHFIEIEWSKHREMWYIAVYNDMGYAYDGWWDEPNTTMEDAINEAIKGAML